MLFSLRPKESLKELNINSKVLNNILKNLTSAMIVDKNKGYYWIEDPITREAIKNYEIGNVLWKERNNYITAYFN